MERILLLLKENIRLLIGAIVVVLVVVFLIALLISGKTTKVLVNGEAFNVSVAKTDKERQLGLSGKSSLPMNQGMLFVFDNSDYYSFWMREMKFPIDIIYISGDEVVTVIENAKPPSSANENLIIYQPEEKSNKVLEVNAGMANKHNIKKGNKVKIENL